MSPACCARIAGRLSCVKAGGAAQKPGQGSRPAPACCRRVLSVRLRQFWSKIFAVVDVERLRARPTPRSPQGADGVSRNHTPCRDSVWFRGPRPDVAWPRAILLIRAWVLLLTQVCSLVASAASAKLRLRQRHALHPFPACCGPRPSRATSLRGLLRCPIMRTVHEWSAGSFLDCYLPCGGCPGS